MSICPIKIIAASIEGLQPLQFNIPEIIACEADCGWWDKNSEQCSFVTIAKHIGSIDECGVEIL